MLLNFDTGDPKNVQFKKETKILCNVVKKLKDAIRIKKLLLESKN